MTQSDRKTYDEATRLQFGLVSKKDGDLADYAINMQAANLAVLQKIGTSYLTPENQKWLEDFVTNLGRAQFIQSLDPLSQASMYLAQQKAPTKTKKRQKTELDKLDLSENNNE